MQELVNDNNQQQQPVPETPAVEMPKVAIKTEMTRRGAKKEKTAAPTGKPAPLADFAKEIVGKVVTFCGTAESGIDTMEGVPMSLVQDPNGRWVLKFFSSDGSRAFLYLDQVAAFYAHGEGSDPLRQPGETGAEGTGQPQSPGGYYAPLTGEHFPDEVLNRRSGLREPGSVKRVPRSPGSQQ